MELLSSLFLAAVLCGVAEPPSLEASASPAGAFGEVGPAVNVEGAFLVGPPASDVLGSEDIWGNPTFVGGVANGGSTSHGVW